MSAAETNKTNTDVQNCSEILSTCLQFSKDSKNLQIRTMIRKNKNIFNKVQGKLKDEIAKLEILK